MTGPNVSRISKSIYQVMLEEYQESSLSPIGDFNILYFIQTVIHVWLSAQPAIALVHGSHFPLVCEPVSGIDCPEMEARHSEFAKRFVHRVKQDSIEGGKPI